jgi:leucyl/phenylalanyl-tRNA--protein transferase
VYQLGAECWFPPSEAFREDGLVAIGGDLSPDRLLLAYERGIFPWSAPEDPLLWWSPDPRAVVRADRVKVSKSMRSVLNQNRFTLTLDRDFEGVIRGCADRPDEGTWITPSFIDSYLELHTLGFAHSAEAWNDKGELAGGLYGVSLGNMFFGESMFSKESNASKAAFVGLSRMLVSWGFEWIDCQIMNPHLASLGAENIPRATFLQALEEAMKRNTLRGPWSVT